MLYHGFNQLKHVKTYYIHIITYNLLHCHKLINNINNFTLKAPIFASLQALSPQFTIPENTVVLYYLNTTYRRFMNIDIDITITKHSVYITIDSYSYSIYRILLQISEFLYSYIKNTFFYSMKMLLFIMN